MMQTIIIYILTPVLWIPLQIGIQAWSLRVLFNWFVSPEFGLPVLSFWQSAGLVIVIELVGVFQCRPQYCKDARTLPEKAGYLAGKIITPPVLVAVGILIRHLGGM